MSSLRSAAAANILKLPSEIIGDEIFSKYLNFEFIISVCSLVCKQFYKCSVNCKLNVKIPRFYDEESFAKCCKSERLKCVNEFVSDCPYSFEEFVKYLDECQFDSLKRLNLIGLEVSNVVARFGNLESLSLIGMGAEIGNSIGNLSRLTYLNLNASSVTSESCQYIQKCELIKNLNLSDNKIGNESCLYLTKLKNLTILRLEDCNISEKGVEHLSQIETLTILNVSKNRIEDDGFVNICKLKNLTSLKAASCSVESIKNITNLIKLTSLNLGQNSIDNEGVKIIGELTNLKTLTLENNVFQPEAVQYLTKLSSMEVLDLRDNNLSFDNVKCLNATNLPKLYQIQIISRHRQYYNF